jgi:hypothetical protein
MTDITLQDIEKEGIKYIEEYLKNNGFTNIGKDTWQYGSTDIKADSFGEKILVQVKTSIFPIEPIEISREERIKIISRALNLKRKAYAAYVKIKEKNRLLESIAWERLN